jgi:hypothetical protein
MIKNIILSILIVCIVTSITISQEINLDKGKFIDTKSDNIKIPKNKLKELIDHVANNDSDNKK